MKKWLNFPNTVGDTSYVGLERLNIILQPGTILWISIMILTYTIFALLADFSIYPYVTFKQMSIQFISEILYEEYILLKNKFDLRVQCLGMEQKFKFPLLLYKN